MHCTIIEVLCCVALTYLLCWGEFHDQFTTTLFGFRRLRNPENTKLRNVLYSKRTAGRNTFPCTFLVFIIFSLLCCDDNNTKLNSILLYLWFISCRLLIVSINHHVLRRTTSCCLSCCCFFDLWLTSREAKSDVLVSYHY